MVTKLINKYDNTTLLSRSIDLILENDNAQESIESLTIQFDYIRCANVCLKSKDINFLEKIKDSIVNTMQDEVDVLVIDEKDKIQSYQELIQMKNDKPSLVIIDLNKVPPLYISNFLIESLIVGLNVLILLDSNYIKGSYFVLPFCDNLNNRDYVQGIIDIDEIKTKAVFNTHSFLG